ncbi:MAG: twin-arginine translocase subunit TatC, partial [Kiritimatiellia bacterium]
MSDDIHKPVAADADDRPRTLLEHLDELRKCLMRCLLAWVLCVLAVGPFCPQVLAWLQAPLDMAGHDPHKLITVMTVDAGLT